MTSRPGNATADLSHLLLNKLNAYALAASAAGVGAIAMAQSAEAKIVYTPAHIKLVPHHVAKIDLDGDGSADVVFTNTVSNTSSFLSAKARGRGVVVKNSPQYGFGVLDMISGGMINAGREFSQQGKLAYLCLRSNCPPFLWGLWGRGGYGAKDHYVGLRFKIEGKVHYGWVRGTVDPFRDVGEIVLHITGYAYESVPNKPIIAGKTTGPDVTTLEPGTLGRLALGKK